MLNLYYKTKKTFCRDSEGKKYFNHMDHTFVAGFAKQTFE